MVGGVVRSTAAARRGRTARWPASIGWCRYRGRRAGAFVRVGDRSVYACVTWGRRPRPYTIIESFRWHGGRILCAVGRHNFTCRGRPDHVRDGRVIT